MAKKQNALSSTSDVHTDTFIGGLNLDANESFQDGSAWLHARNLINNSQQGDLGMVRNEPSNLYCTAAPYPVIGAIHLYDTTWAIYSTDDVNSEIGLFDENLCTYSKVVNDPCLSFKRTNLITGAARENYDCTWQLYWADGLNPDRTLNINDVPYVTTKTVVDDCVVETSSTVLDCEKIRLSRLVGTPCIKLKQSEIGTLFNGSYQVYLAYSIEGIRVTDYMAVSNIQAIFFHENAIGSLEVTLENVDTDAFDEFELVIVSYVDRQTKAQIMGYYSTQTRTIVIDTIDQRLNAVPLEYLYTRKPSYEKSDSIFRVTDYLLRVAPTSKFDFNYQLLANKIETKWVAVEYDADYYADGGNNVGYMRDEQYAFFIRWVYNTGEKSYSYHIPGRKATPAETVLLNPDGADVWEPTAKSYWEVYNTASTTQSLNQVLADGGVVIAKGKMGYWQSTERYPDNKPEVYGELCGKPIRHHKMPDDCIIPRHNQGGTKIRVLGVEFSKIAPPVDNYGNIIPEIVGYEILRGSRKGNRSIIAKGIINNMFEYNIPGRPDRKGMFANYPFNDVGADPYLTDIWYEDGRDVNANKSLKNALTKYSKKYFTFHSPDTQFKHPFLSASEIRIYGDAYGRAEGRFIEPEGHPKHKLLTDLDAILSILIGLGNAARGIRGPKTYTLELPKLTGGDSFGVAAGITAAAGATAGGITAVAVGSGLSFLQAISGLDQTTKAGLSAAYTAAGGSFSTSTEASNFNELPPWLQLFNIVPMLLTFTAEGANGFLELIKQFINWRQYALQHVAHGKYDKFICTTQGAKRRKFVNGIYLKNQLYSYGTNISVNNRDRSRMVMLESGADIPDAKLAVTDNSKYTLGTEKAWNKHDIKKVLETSFEKDIASKYVALKIDFDNQYGQLRNVSHDLAGCIQTLPSSFTVGSRFTSDIIFGGDIYISRYTEKDTMFFFRNWLAGKNFEDGTEFDYRNYVNVPYPRHYVNTENYYFDDFVQGLGQSTKQALLNLFAGQNSNNDDIQNNIDTLPSDLHNLDRENKLALFVAKGFFYLFNSGVKDFFAESEINCGYRDHDDEPATRHYDHKDFTDLDVLFRASEITKSNYFKYDHGLSAINWFTYNLPAGTVGTIQRPDYDPIVSEKCFIYNPNRVIYSMPQLDLRADNWRNYLALNYQDFNSEITAIKPIGQAGALIMFRHESPMYFVGADTLESKGGVEITIGDGGLFDPRQNIRNVVNTDAPYEYGSCQNKWAITATPAGVFYVSQNQGKIFVYGGNNIQDITSSGVKWWMSKFLPYQLLIDYPNFELTDNSVIGVGLSTVYDNLNQLLYISKKDYKIKDKFRELVTYNKDNIFKLGNANIYLGDPEYFDDASWTISYDVKLNKWISFHDWHPTFMLPAKNYFMTIDSKAIWKHNIRCDSYCNFYGVDYPFEIETVINLGQEVSTLRSVEYQMEAYQYKDNCHDKIHLLDFNFDRAVIYNSEQVSGMLNLVVSPKNDPYAVVSYPQVTPTAINILYSKEENKYRFNEFWDITTDRGEFSGVARNIWNTAPNGYIRTLNTVNLNYNKDPHQHKKFRHYNNRLFLRRNISGSTRINLRITNGKTNYSFR
jgi:hypothetical protein